MSRNSNQKSLNQNFGNQKFQPADGLPSLRRDLINAKLFLQQRSDGGGDSLFDHLARVISKALDERPKNIVDSFELFSERVRVENFKVQEAKFEDAYKEPERLELARKRLSILILQSQHNTANVREDKNSEENQLSAESIANGNDEDVDEEEEQNDVFYYEAAMKDLCELQFYWNLLGIGFSREEVFTLSCAIRQLRKSKGSINSCRFWGKIFGLQNDYYVVECTLTTEEMDSRIDAIEQTINIMNLELSSGATSFDISERNRKSSIGTKVEEISGDMENSSSKDNGSDVNENKYPAEWNFSMNIPESSYRSPIEIPSEEIGHGINRHVYFVCHNLSDGEWVELPTATPHQINVSRRVMKYLTGNLDAELEKSYPSFPGTEKNYLRALIARISAGTHVAPRNFYKLGMSSGDEDEEEEDEFDDENICNNDKPIRVNAAYRPLSHEKLSQLDNFVHIKPEILKQGRVCFFDGKSLLINDNNAGSQSDMSNNDGDDDAVESDVNVKNNNNVLSPEMPNPLFASCSGDQMTNDFTTAWTIRLNDSVDSPLVLLESNVWPGAFTFATDRICDNIYIGFGNKSSSRNYSPPALPKMKIEDENGEDIEEIYDPTVESEQEAASKKLSDVGDDKDSSDDVKLNENQ